MADFSDYADIWWAEDKTLWSLHELNRLRSTIPGEFGHWKGKTVLDVGCGAGLFAETMLSYDASVVAFDESQALIDEAKKHAEKNSLNARIDYRVGSADDLSMYEQNKYDAVFAFELIEHLDEPEKAINGMISALVDGGLLVISSPNRTSLGFLLGIVLPEYVLSWLPVGTHRYHQFVSMQVLLNKLLLSNFTVLDVRGTWYYPLKKKFDWCHNTDVHYTIIARKQAIAI